MDTLSEELKQVVNVTQAFVATTLAKEKLSSEAEKERQLLSEWLRKLRIKMGGPPPNTAESAAPARPPKGTANCEEADDIYDDVTDTEQDVEDYEDMNPEEKNQASDSDQPAEDYEPMNEAQAPDSEEASKGAPTEDYEVMTDPPAAPAVEKTPTDAVVQEDNYEVPEQEQENYEEPQAQEEPNYEVTDSAPVGEWQDINTTEPWEEATYEGIDLIGSASTSTPAGRDRTSTVQLESLKSPIKPDDIVDKIKEGFLFKDRTVEKHRLFGGRWQKRYVVVRDYALYYYKSKTDKEQRGTILLPGYSVAQCKNKDKEFELTVKEGRTFKFMAESKDDFPRWINAIKKAADAKLSDRQSKVLDELRSKDSSCDEDSLHYEGVETKAADSAAEPGELYDDVGCIAANYEIAETTAPPSRAAQEEDYEVANDAKQETTQVEEEYEVAEELSPRPGKQQEQEPVRQVKAEPIQEDEYEVASDPPPASKPQLPLPPVLQPQHSPLPPRPPRPGKPAETRVEDEAPQQPPRPGAKPALPPQPTKKPPVSVPQEAADEPKSSEETVIDYANVYMAKWNCEANDEHELHFSRGDLIYVYEKPHEQWWIGSLFKPQGCKVGLLPRHYVMEAYDL